VINFISFNGSRLAVTALSRNIPIHIMNIRFERNKTATVIVMYSLYLYFLGLSLRKTSKALIIFKNDKRRYVSIWNWIQRFDSYQLYKRKRVFAFIIDGIVIRLET
jgi:putative transposase